MNPPSQSSDHDASSVIPSALIILAGGKGTRMGNPNKGLLCLEGKSLLQRIIERLSVHFQETLVVGSSFFPLTQDFDPIRATFLEDQVAGVGPLGGMFTALQSIGSPCAFVMGWDTPLITWEVVDWLYQIHYWGKNAITIPFVHDRPHPLAGFYQREVVKTITQQIQSGHYAVRSLCALEKTMMVYFSQSSIFTNINSWEDFEGIEKWRMNDERSDDPNPTGFFDPAFG